MQKRKFLILKKQQLYDSKFRSRRQSLEFKGLQKTINRSLNKSDEAETIEKDVAETDETDEAMKENRKRTAEDDENQNVKRQKKQDDQPESDVNQTEKPNLKYIAKLDRTGSSDASLQIDENKGESDDKGESEAGSEDGPAIGNEVTIDNQNHMKLP